MFEGSQQGGAMAMMISIDVSNVLLQCCVTRNYKLLQAVASMHKYTTSTMRTVKHSPLLGMLATLLASALT